MKVTITVYENGNELFSKLLDEGVFRAGRSEFSDIVLPSDSISRSHFELRITAASVYMTNMSTAGKVKLNGKPRETAELADGDELIAGPYRIVVFHGARESSPDVPAIASDGNAISDDQLNSGAPNEDAYPGADAPAFDAPPEIPSEGTPPPPLPDNSNEGYGDGSGVPVMEAEPPLEGRTSQMLRAETQVEIKPVVAKLIFEEGPRAGEEMFLEAYEVALGRSKKADIYLEDEKLSRIHAKIARVGMGYRLIDLNSRNGTYVNGMRVLEHPLNSFDEIQIGSSKIKFLIHDMIVSDMARAQLPATMNGLPIEQTKSLPMAPLDQAQIQQLQAGGGPSQFSEDPFAPWNQETFGQKIRRSPTKYLAFGAVVLILIFLILPNGKKTPKPETPAVTAQKAPANIPQEFMDLSPQIQRRIEGWYNSAEHQGRAKNYKEALAYLDQIHKIIPYYKQSMEMQDRISKQLKLEEIETAKVKAQHDEKEDLKLYLQEGLEYLKEGDFDRAGEAFNAAIVIDPSNRLAAKGLKAAEYKVRNIEDIPADKDPETEKRKQVADLFQKAVGAFTNKSYQLAIDTAEKIRTVELKGDTQYLNEAKQIIDRARMLQKEEFEPFLIQAKEKYAEGDYNASRDLCEEMLKRDSAYEEAKDCSVKAKKQLNRLAKEAYTHGYILESMNRIEEARQYWNRAKNYVRQGDDYYDKVMKKLEYYQ